MNRLRDRTDGLYSDHRGGVIGTIDTMTGKSQHVAPRGGKWIVRTSGAARASASFPTRQEAVARARTIAKERGTELYIHGTDGRIRERMSYGKDAPPPKG